MVEEIWSSRGNEKYKYSENQKLFVEIYNNALEFRDANSLTGLNPVIQRAENVSLFASKIGASSLVVLFFATIGFLQNLLKDKPDVFSGKQFEIIRNLE